MPDRAEGRAVAAVWAVWEACPDYGSEGCVCGIHATPDPDCPVHWAVQRLEAAGFDFHQTKAIVIPPSGWDALSDEMKAEWQQMVAEMRDPETKPCGCGYPKQECLRVVLRNGPPFPPRPCEPTR